MSASIRITNSIPSYRPLFAMTRASCLAKALFLLLFSGACNAGVILGIDSVTTNMGFADNNWLPENAVNQSGLPAYVSGVTDFDTHVTSSHITGLKSGWLAPNGATSGNFDLDLGGLVGIQSLAYWTNFEPSGLLGASIDEFNLYASTNASFTNSTLLGSFVNPGNRVSGAEVFSFTPTLASHVRVEILSIQQGGRNFAAIGELAFESGQVTLTVPEPWTLPLLGIGAVGLIGLSRNKRKQTGCCTTKS